MKPCKPDHSRNLKKAITTLTAAGTVYFAASGISAIGAALAADVTISIDGVVEANGPLYVSLQTEDQFMKDSWSYGERVSSPSAGTIEIVIKDVDAGDYAVSVWHDINGNNEFGSRR